MVLNDTSTGFSSLNIERPSGSHIRACVLKTGKGMVEQAAKMRHHPEVFAPILALLPGWGYLMPVLEPVKTCQEITVALDKLQDYWESFSIQYFISRGEYQDYVMDAQAPTELLQLAERLFRRVVSHPQVEAGSIHGDATLENIMVAADDNVHWLDPSTRPCPADREVDVGKLLQSLYGYHTMPAGAAMKITDFLKKQKIDMDLAEYYLVTHLVRLWRHQPDKRDWALEVAKTFDA